MVEDYCYPPLKEMYPAIFESVLERRQLPLHFNFKVYVKKVDSQLCY